MIGAVVVVLLAAMAWLLSPIEHRSRGAQSRTFTVMCEFATFRQIMVRKNATAAIVGKSGMALVDERIQVLLIDDRFAVRLLDRDSWCSGSAAELTKKFLRMVFDNDLSVNQPRLAQKSHLNSIKRVSCDCRVYASNISNLGELPCWAGL